MMLNKKLSVVSTWMIELSSSKRVDILSRHRLEAVDDLVWAISATALGKISLLLTTILPLIAYQVFLSHVSLAWQNKFQHNKNAHLSTNAILINKRFT